MFFRKVSQKIQIDVANSPKMVKYEIQALGCLEWLEWCLIVGLYASIQNKQMTSSYIEFADIKRYPCLKGRLTMYTPLLSDTTYKEVLVNYICQPTINDTHRKNILTILSVVSDYNICQLSNIMTTSVRAITIASACSYQTYHVYRVKGGVLFCFILFYFIL